MCTHFVSRERPGSFINDARCCHPSPTETCKSSDNNTAIQTFRSSRSIPRKMIPDCITLSTRTTHHPNPFQRGCQPLGRQAHHIVIAALDAFDDAGAMFLDRVRAGFVKRVDLTEILGTLWAREWPHPDACRLGERQFHVERAMQQTNAGDDLVSLSRQPPEHLLRIFKIARFAEEI